MTVYEMIQELSKYKADDEIEFHVKASAHMMSKQSLTEKMETILRKSPLMWNLMKMWSMTVQGRIIGIRTMLSLT